MKIYVLVGELEQGPYSKSEIFALMKNGSISADAFARWENQDEWQPINKVLTSGNLGFFSSEQIAKQQEELPEAPILVPDLVPPRRETAENEPPVKSRRRVVLMAIAAILLATCSVLLLIRANSEVSPLTVENIADVPPTTPQVPPSRPATMSIAKFTPTPSLPKAAKTQGASVSESESQANETPPAPVIASALIAPSLPSTSASFPSPLFQATAISIPLPTTKEITAAQMWVSIQIEKPRGVLVLCLDRNENAEKALQDKGWLDFARDQQLAFVAVAFSSPKEFSDKKNGYMRAEAGSGAVLLEGLNKAGLRNLPLFTYGRGEGGTFVSSFANLSNAPVRSWAIFTDAIQTKQNFKDQRPVLIGCDYELTKVNPNLHKAFETAREADLKWTWLSVVGSPKERMPRFETFVKDYFSGILNSGLNDGVWVGTDNLEQLAFTEIMSSPKNAAWLPNKSLMAAWKQMMPTPDQQKDPIVIRKIVDTKVKSQPQIEMFLRLPPQFSKSHPLKGTLAFCTWAGDAQVIQKQLLYRIDMKQLALPGPTGVVARLIRYAEQHDLAILTWTTSQVWSLKGSTEELAQKDEKEFDRNFDKLASAWENGVKFFARANDMPDKDMLLYGISRGAQWAHRLALRKPDRFLAVHVHIPSTFDSPTPAANSVLWLVTTGELESGYMRARRFYNECRKMNYPIIFKAIMGLGHSDSALADNLGFRFFDYALAMRQMRDQIAASKTNMIDRADAMKTGAWKSNFESPPFVGDFQNQEIFPLDKAGMVPVALQVPLPTVGLAQAWEKK